MNPIKYTDRKLNVYQSNCSSPSDFTFTVNNAPIPNSRINTLFIVGGFFAFEIEFGILSPGDVFKVTDACGGEPFEQVVKDDYIYVEVPSGVSYAGNGIGPNDEYPPYSKLSAPLVLGKCEPVQIGSHGLVNYYVFSPNTGGKFSVNGSPLTNTSSAINPLGYDINFNGFQGTPSYSINPDGSITANCAVKLESNTHYSGRIPLTLEYEHDGGPPNGDISFGFKALAIRHISNGSCVVEKASLGGALVTTTFPGNPTSKYKVTYDGTYYRAYVDNVLVDQLRRFVQYDVSSGSLSPSSSAGLDYLTSVVWTGMQSGEQWISVLVDGVLYTRQKVSVAEDMVINPSVTDVACSGTSTGKIVATTTGGKAPLQYSLGAGIYQNSNTFTGLQPGNYTIQVRDASGCVASRSVTVGSSTPLSVQVASKNDAGCAGEANGQIVLSATGGDGDYAYAQNGQPFGTSATFSGLAAGSYTFTVKDASGCQATVKDTIRTRGNLVASISGVQHVSCFGGNNGSASVSTSGSVTNGQLLFSIDNGNNFQSSPDFGNLTAGTYTILLKDDVCSTSLNAQIQQPAPLTFATNLTPVSCFGSSDGKIDVNDVQGGTAPYEFSRNGTSFQASPNFSSLADGSYKITVKDARGCLKESGILDITQPAMLTVAVFTKTDVSCFGGNNGAVTLTGSGGTSPYSFSADSVSFQSSGTLNNLSAKSYTFHIRDANQCRATVKGEILQPPVLSISAALLSEVFCFGGNNGSIQATASGGNGQLTYSLDGNQFGLATSFQNLSAGTYQITVRDANQCRMQSAAIVVSQPPLIVPVVQVQDVQCFGGTDGTLTLTASGGTGSYQFSLDATSYQTAAAFTGLSSGSYTVYVKDVNNCVVNRPATVGQPTALAGSSSITQQVLCYGGSSGIIDTQMQGGTAPYRYAINSVDYQPASRFESLPIGTYRVVVKDAHDCPFQSNELTITQPTDLILAVAGQTAVKCFGGNDGSVQLTASGGTQPYTFAKATEAFNSSPDFTGLASQSWTFRVKDAHACIKEVTTTVTQPAAAYTVTLVSQTNLTCYGAGTGVLNIQNNGGTAPYQVSLNNVDFEDKTLFNNLQAGTYTLYGKDANNCRFTLPNLVLTQPSDITLRLLNKSDVDCEYYQKGQFLVGASGSNGGFTYALSGTDFKFNPVSRPAGESGQFDNMAAGDYTITARDQLGCVKDLPVTIIPKNTSIRFETTKVVPTDCNATNGSIGIINVAGGRPPYQYSISTTHSFTDQPVFEGLRNGNYIVTVADDLCSYKQHVDLSLPAGIKANYTLSPVDCSTPVATLTIDQITGGNGNYALSLNNAAFTANRTFTNLHPNVYSLVIQDAPQSCQTVLSIEIKEQNRADLQIVNLQNVLCFEGNSGSITVRGDNNVGPFRYALNGGSLSDNPAFTGLTAGTYKVYAQNRIGCLDSLRVTLTQPTRLTSSFTKKDNNCFGDLTGSIELAGSGGTPTYTYSLDGTSYQESGSFSSLPAKAYTSFVKDQHGCISQVPVVLTQPNLLTLQPTYRDTIRCQGEQNGVVELRAHGGTPEYVYSRDSLNYLSASAFENLAVGSYSFFVKDTKGCIGKANIALTEPPLLQISVLDYKDPLCHQGADGTIRVKALGGNGSNTYLINNAGSQQAELFQNLSENSYRIKVTDRKGCTAETELVSLKWPEKITASHTTVQPLCFGDANGKITLQVAGGIPSYRALFEGKSYDPDQQTFEFMNVRSGNYTIEVLDKNNCSLPVPVLVEQPTALAATVSVQNNNCFGDNTGKIEVVATGATPGYTYAIQTKPFTGSGVFSSLQAGSYAIRVRDAQGCLLVRQVEVIQPTAVAVSAINTDTVRCFGEKNAKVHVLASGGTPSYRYSLDGLQFATDSIMTGLGAGSHRFWVKDSKNCEKTVSITLLQPTEAKLALSEKLDPSCAGDQNGTVRLAASGGNGGFTYWRDNAVSQKAELFTGLTQADYAFKAVDWKGCTATISTVALKWPRPVVSSLQLTQPVCYGDQNGSVVVVPEGGTAPYRITSAGLSPTYNATSKAWNFDKLSAGTYTFLIQDANSCATSTTARLLSADGFQPVSFPTPEPICKGQEVILYANNPGKATQWYYNGKRVDSLQNYQTVTVVEPGLYKLVLANRTGCQAEQEFNLVNNTNALKADFLMTVQAFENDTITALDISQPGPDEIIWETPYEAEVIQKTEGKLAFAIQQEGTYEIKLKARKGDCLNTKIRPIKIFRKDDIDQTDSLLHYQELNLIQEMILYPNPNFGAFQVDVTLTRATDITLSIARSSNNVEIYRENQSGQKKYHFDLKLKNYVQDIYIVTILSGKSIAFKKVLILN